MIKPVSLLTVWMGITLITQPLASAETSTARPPNFIFILSDDIAQGDLGVYGQELIETPRLDQLASEGTRYLQAYCGTSVCAPSRASFFTGLHTGHCPVRGNYEVPPEGQLPLPAQTVTIAEVAKSANYATATFGKWGMGFFGTSGAPDRQGVDHFFGYNCQRHAHSYFPTYLFDDAQPFLLPGNDGRGVGETYAQELIQNDLIRWVRQQADQPFMLFYAITLPHGRHEIDDFGIYSDKPWTDKQKAYAAQVTQIDSDVGELADTLRELGIAENTLLIFSGDNGSSFNPSSEIGKRFNQARNGLRGYKRGMYEGALRQAAFAWWPGTVPADRVDDRPWAFWDLLPTFVELSGATPPAGYETDGVSLLSYLKGGEAPRRDYFYWELHLGNRPVQATRFGQWKAVRNGIDRPIELYNLTHDATETEDLSSVRQDLVGKAKQIFATAHRPDPNWPLDRRPDTHSQSAKKAWEIKRQRDKETYIPENAIPYSATTSGQAMRVTELDAYWAEVSRAVKEGDFEGYRATCHPQGVLVSGTTQTSYPLESALARWKPGFMDTQSGKISANVAFRFSNRLGDDTTAHETGMFHYSTKSSDGEVTHAYIHFEVLLIKDDTWRIMMEYQKTAATHEEWEQLE